MPTGPVQVRFDLDALDITRALGYRDPGQVTPRIRAHIAAGFKTARTLVEPLGVYAVFDQAHIPDFVPLPDACAVGLGVCTIGRRLEEESRRLMELGHMLDSLVLDAIGSEAAEAAADALDQAVALDHGVRGLHPGRRISPGYGRFALTSQAGIFRLLPASVIGVSLTDSMMMVPRKSVSFALPFTLEQDPRRGQPPCADCDRRACPHRKETP